MTAELSQALKVVLANHYAVSLKAQFYHWNVTGPNPSAKTHLISTCG
jgi:DNA-binding ferritin-like protein